MQITDNSGTRNSHIFIVSLLRISKRDLRQHLIPCKGVLSPCTWLSVISEMTGGSGGAELVAGVEGLSVGSKFAENFGGVIGIDLGTTYSCVAVWLESEQRTEVRQKVCGRGCAGARACVSVHARAGERERACFSGRSCVTAGGC